MSMGKTSEAFDRMLRSIEFKYSYTEENEQVGIFQYGFQMSGRLGSIAYRVFCNDGNSSIHIVSALGPHVDTSDPDQVARIGRLITRINWSQALGALKYDARDGEITCDVGIWVDDLDKIPTELVKKAFDTSVLEVVS